jgi:hypothetical protein
MESEPKLYDSVLTRFLHANRGHFARKRSNCPENPFLLAGTLEGRNLCWNQPIWLFRADLGAKTRGQGPKSDGKRQNGLVRELILWPK